METKPTETSDLASTSNRTVLSFVKPTPMWATWIFRIVFVMTGVATFIIAQEPAISEDWKIRLGLYLKGFDMLTWGITRAIGIEQSVKQ